MKATKIVGATTLAGALLFTGVNAHAAESEVNANNAVNIASDVMKKGGSAPENIDFHSAKDKGDYYFVDFNNKSGVGSGGVRVYKDGTVEVGSGYFGSSDKGDFNVSGQYQFAENQNNTNESSQATDNTVDNNQTMTQDSQQPSQTSDNATMTHKTSEENMNQMTQSNAKELPTTGETSNSTLITLVASVLLAAGSLLTFNRFSKNNK
ncbi:LPXTG-motif cell wall-anchored protein [Staphylococcus caledonicus]|uniref:LPXTG cell wall anchor domain-containing protein n=1 Tax=Staphylococcus caledonicus TaxID=2741333 RepID=UPI003C30C7F6